MTVSEDALGTVRGRIGGRRPEARLLIGSHIDTVIDAGKYDGPLGVIAGILAVRAFRRAQARSCRSASTCWPSATRRARAFRSTLAALVGLRRRVRARRRSRSPDRNGVTLADALKAYGKNPADIAAAAYEPDEVAGYVEVHIEQGPVLEAENQPLGVVTGIVGQSRMRVIVTGRGGPRRHRADARCATTRSPARPKWCWRSRRSRASTRTTAWSAPSAASRRRPARSTSFPAASAFTVDLRSLTDALRTAAIERSRREARRIAMRAQARGRLRAVPRDRDHRLRAGAAGRAGRRHRRCSATSRSGCRRAPATTRR